MNIHPEKGKFDARHNCHSMPNTIFPLQYVLSTFEGRLQVSLQHQYLGRSPHSKPVFSLGCLIPSSHATQCVHPARPYLMYILFRHNNIRPNIPKCLVSDPQRKKFSNLSLYFHDLLQLKFWHFRNSHIQHFQFNPHQWTRNVSNKEPSELVRAITKILPHELSPTINKFKQHIYLHHHGKQSVQAAHKGFQIEVRRNQLFEGPVAHSIQCWIDVDYSTRSLLLLLLLLLLPARSCQGTNQGFHFLEALRVHSQSKDNYWKKQTRRAVHWNAGQACSLNSSFVQRLQLRIPLHNFVYIQITMLKCFFAASAITTCANLP